MRSLLGNVLLTRTQISAARHTPQTQIAGRPILTYHVDVVEVLERYPGFFVECRR